MSYIDTADMVEDWPLRRRIIACAASLGVDDPDLWVEQGIWGICARPEVVAAWASAKAGNVQNPGADPAVITDAAILAAVQARHDATGPDALAVGGLQARIDAAIEAAVGRFNDTFGAQVIAAATDAVEARITDQVVEAATARVAEQATATVPDQPDPVITEPTTKGKKAS